MSLVVCFCYVCNMDYKKNIEGADEMTTDELFERLNDNEKIELLFEQKENTNELLFQQQQRIYRPSR